MDERERHILQVFRDALDTPPDGRVDFIARRCGEDADLSARVHDMLRGIADEEWDDGDSPDESRRSGEAKGAADPAEDLLIGEQLGGYRVIERIGRGGMGVVYRARRETADFSQDVAIKLIRRGFDFDDVHARFLRERRILARLSHPNLAHFIDGGVSADGRPWFALEFVRGVTITRWCDAGRVGIRGRVERFLEVCSAVQHAHTQLVVHRDLKPANILVNDEGAVRLLDFGVAGLLSGDDGEHVHSTIGLRHAMTPEYAAPEQFGSGGVGVAADVYALGVILYELVSGVLPYELARGNLAEAERQVRELPPQSLVAAVSRESSRSSERPPEPVAQSGGEDSPVSRVTERLQARAISYSGYSRLVRGDLGRIIETCIAKEPSERYATVAAFADDLSRWLAGAPVRVSGNSLRYRIGKFVRRHRAAVAAVSMLTLALLATTGWALHGARETRVQRDVALAEAARANAVRDYVMLAFRDAAEQRDAAKLTAREVLKRGADAIFSQFGDQPETGQTTALMMSELFLMVNDVESAGPLLERLVAWPGIERNPDVLASARYNLAQVKYFLGQRGIAAELLGQAQTYWSAQPQRYADKLSESRSVQSNLLRAEGKYEQAIAVIEHGIAERRALGRGPDRELGMLLATATLALIEGGRHEDAWQRGNEGVEVFATLGLANSSGALGALNNRASASTHLLKFDEADADFRRVVELNRQLYGPSIGLAVSLNNVAGVLIRRERYSDAIAPLEEALPMAIEFGGDRGRSAMWPRINLAETYAATGRIREAQGLADAALEIAEKDYGAGSAFAGIAHRAQAKIRIAQGDHAAARAEIDAATKIFTALGSGGEALRKGIDRLRQQLESP